MAQIIAEAPALPGVPAFMAALMRSTADAASLALSILKDVILTRPRDRDAALQVVRARVHAQPHLQPHDAPCILV